MNQPTKPGQRCDRYGHLTSSAIDQSITIMIDNDIVAFLPKSDGIDILFAELINTDRDKLALPEYGLCERGAPESQ